MKGRTDRRPRSRSRPSHRSDPWRRRQTVYRTRIPGHGTALRGDLHAAGSVPRRPGRRGAHEAVLLGQPVLVIEVDERLHGIAQLGHRAVDAAVDDLLFEGCLLYTSDAAD